MATLAHRTKLHEQLVKVLGSRNVYFQPPESIKLKYPCIIYHTSIGRSFNADNNAYIFTDSYDVTVIDSDPDSQIPDRVLRSFSMIRKEKPYNADGLYHSPFVLYF